MSWSRMMADWWSFATRNPVTVGRTPLGPGLDVVESPRKWRSFGDSRVGRVTVERVSSMGMMPDNAMMARARAELAQKTLQQIQHETALTWTARFLVARELGRPLVEVEDMRQEAVEHAALAGDLDLAAFLLWGAR